MEATNVSQQEKRKVWKWLLLLEGSSIIGDIVRQMVGLAAINVWWSRGAGIFVAGLAGLCLYRGLFKDSRS